MSRYYKKKTWTKEVVSRRPFALKFPPSEAQLAARDTFLNTTMHIFMRAVAGSGKSTTLKYLMAELEKIQRGSRGAYLAFNKSIVQEMEPDCPGSVDVKTRHAFGMAIVGKHATARKAPDKYKTFTILEGFGWNANDENDDHAYERVKAMADLIHFMKLNMIDPEDKFGIDRMMDLYGITDIDEIDKFLNALPDIFKQIIATGKEGYMDFDDMIYLPVQLGWQFPKYPVLYLDEYQDSTVLGMEFDRRMLQEGGRVVIVGDEKQCQPAGTMVLMNDNTKKPIEEIRPGDRVVGYAGRDGVFTQNNPVTNVASREYRGLMYHVQVGSFMTSATDNHKWIVKWDLDRSDHSVVYLMKRGDQFRIGRCRLFYQQNRCYHFGPGMRARSEKADALWILGAYASEREAMRMENLFSYRYGIPQLMFQDSKSGGYTDQENLDWFWEAFGNNDHDAIRLLNACGMSVNYPLWESQSNVKMGGWSSFRCCSMNLIPDVMKMTMCNRYDSKDRKPEWCSFHVETEKVECEVFSLNVERVHSYCANGILTGNSIYGFAGANTNSMDIAHQAFPGADHPLDVTYRCAKLIVEESKGIVPHFTAWEGAPDGLVETLEQFEYENLKPDALILCRTNAPLVPACFKCLRQGIKAEIRGRDIGANLISTITKLKCGEDLTKMLDALEFQTEAKKAKIAVRKRPSVAAMEALDDTREVIEAFAEQPSVKTVSDLKNAINRMFSDDRKGITFSTGHKAKGLEAPQVGILNANRMRIGYEGMTEEQAQQEANVEYVMKSRPKTHLIYQRDKK